MNDPISDLLGVVREEIHLYRDLVEHCQRKTALLVGGSIEAIQESNRIEETYYSRLRVLEAEMKRLCQVLGRISLIPREEFTLLKLANTLDHAPAAEIRSQSALLRNIVKHLKSISQRNTRLIEKSIQYSRGLLAIISNASGAYHQDGLFAQIPMTRPTFSQQA